MRTTNKELIRLVSKLADTIETRKTAEKFEQELKREIKAYMNGEILLEAGDFCVFLEMRSRTDLNKTQLEADLGFLTYSKYLIKSHFEMMSLKSLKVSES